ncbi:MAG: phenylacetate--CoA ligase family protein [Burkholderiales bacterium]|nr:phenylacetate--CoA ligase family protein [Burkholderiales bacterium]
MNTSITRNALGYTALCASLIFPLHELAKGHSSVRRRRELERSQWWPRERIADYQLRRLREFLDAVRETVPYYRDLFGRIGFVPADLGSISDLSRLPLLGKNEIRAHADAMKALGSSLSRYNTGGSSGEPLVFYVGKDRVSHDIAAKWRATRWWGVDIGDPEIVIWGSPIELGAQDWIRSLRDAVLRTSLFKAFELTDALLRDFVARVRSERPAMLFGYPSVMARIAAYAKATRQRLNDCGIRVAFVTSERLYPDQRQSIQEVFGCPVANGYGGRDAGFIAHECPAGGMHISAEDIIVEIVDPAGRPLAPGQPGEIVVTHMATGGFPFIRYRTGDVGTLDERACKCGRGLPMLREIEGRTTDFVVSRDGTVSHGLALIYVVRELSGIRKFKIIQESVDRTRVLLVPDAGFDPAVTGRIRTGMERRLGAGVAIDIELVDEIPAEASGKFRYVVSKVAAI